MREMKIIESSKDEREPQKPALSEAEGAQRAQRILDTGYRIRDAG